MYSVNITCDFLDLCIFCGRTCVILSGACIFCRLVFFVNLSCCIMATLDPPVNLNSASLQDMLDVGWIPPQDAEEIVRQRGPSGRLYLARLLRTTTLSQLKLDELTRQGMITARFEDDGTYSADETQSLVSETPSMREELEKMREENRLLREAMEQQMTLQQDVLARFVGEMATRERSDRAAVRGQETDLARRAVVTQEQPVERTSLAVSSLEGANESLAWDFMEQPSGVVPLSTNPFVTAITSSVQPQASVNELTTRPSDGARFVSTGVADNREREVSSSRAVGSVEQGSALTGQRAGDNVWAELQRLSLQMELLLTNARRSQDIGDGAGSSCRSAQGSGDESGREARNPRVVRLGRSGYAAPHSSHRYDGERPWTGDQHVAGGLMDAGFQQEGGWLGERASRFGSQRDQLPLPLPQRPPPPPQQPLPVVHQQQLFPQQQPPPFPQQQPSSFPQQWTLSCRSQRKSKMTIRP